MPDVLVIGAGVAGLSAALAANEHGASVAVINKARPNSMEIVGFNLPVTAEDSPSRFYRDAYASSCQQADPSLLKVLCEELPATYQWLEDMGLNFRDAGGAFPVRLAADSSVARTVYVTDRTGPLILSQMRKILKQQGLAIREGWVVSEIRRYSGGYEATLRKGANSEVVTCRAIVFTSGGGAALYSRSTNRPSSSGDGYWLALQLGAELVDMEFVQFEPFIVCEPRARNYAVPTTLINDGALVYDAQGNEVLPRNSEGTYSGVTKFAMALAMVSTVRSGRGGPFDGVFFDLSPVAEPTLEKYPRLLSALQKGGHPGRVLEVSPAAHHMMGGIAIDANGATSVAGVFAAGEAAGGVHGANRMAGNSAPDGWVFGRRAGYAAAKHAAAMAPRPMGHLEDWAGGAVPADARVGEVLQSVAGVIRSEDELKGGLREIEILRSPAALLAQTIIRSALNRRESRGSHFRDDFPQSGSRCFQNRVLYGSNGLQVKERDLK